MRAMRLDHVAHPCRELQATHRFYSELLGLHLAQAYAGRDLLLVYALPGGGSLAFSISPNITSADAPNQWERQHVGLTVPNRSDLDRWLRRLEQHGVQYQLMDNERIYFADPNGLVIEIEVAAPVPSDPQASEVLERWLRSHQQ